eukprot:GHVO01031360.1.p3 GENE.GHVO01031360.1~~GHVO01031360.1.p3  ORF type:complete len:104 (-),score=16.61 GHVO01031360.1:219-530(-)
MDAVSGEHQESVSAMFDLYGAYIRLINDRFQLLSKVRLAVIARQGTSMTIKDGQQQNLTGQRFNEDSVFILWSPALERQLTDAFKSNGRNQASMLNALLDVDR